MMFEKYRWEQYLILERDFINSRKYISFKKSNLEMDSIFLKTQILVLGSEIEIAFRKLINYVSLESVGKIDDYKRILLKEFPDFENYKTKIIGTDMYFYPFKNWSNEKLVWWEFYNKIKHGSTRYKPKLDVALNLLSAYYIILHIIHIEEARKSKLESVSYYPSEFSM